MNHLSCKTCHTSFAVESGTESCALVCNNCHSVVSTPSIAPTAKISPLNAVKQPDTNITAKLIETLALYFASKTHRQPSDFARDAKVVGTSHFPVYCVELKTLYEERNIVRQDQPYEGEALPEFKLHEQNVNVWDYRLSNEVLFERKELLVTLTGSQRVLACPRCKSVGKVDCPNCDRKGKIVCGRCQGTGNEQCRSCRGTGEATQYRTFQKQVKCTCAGGWSNGHICSQCNGAGWHPEDFRESYQVSCGGCNGQGQVTCEQCDGDQFLKCQPCNGQGNVICARCAGNRSIMTYLSLKRTFEPSSDKRILCDSNHLNDDLRHLDSRKDFRKLGEATSPNFEMNRNYFPAVPLLNHFINNALVVAGTRTNSAKRLISQQLHCSQADIFAVNYTLNEQTYSSSFFGVDLRVIADDNLVTDSFLRDFDATIHLFNLGYSLKAADQMWKLQFLANRDSKCRTIFQENKRRIPFVLFFLLKVKSFFKGR